MSNKSDHQNHNICTKYGMEFSPILPTLMNILCNLENANHIKIAIIKEYFQKGKLVIEEDREAYRLFQIKRRFQRRR